MDSFIPFRNLVYGTHIRTRDRAARRILAAHIRRKPCAGGAGSRVRGGGGSLLREMF